MITCPPLPNPADGSVEVLDNTPGGRANYSCNQGFVLVGELSRVCGTEGEWQEEQPSCQGLKQLHSNFQISKSESLDSTFAVCLAEVDIDFMSLIKTESLWSVTQHFG